MKTEPIFIVHPTTNEQITALKAFVKAMKIKFEISTEKPYNPAFVKKIEQSQKDKEEGKGTSMKIEDFNKLWK